MESNKRLSHDKEIQLDMETLPHQKIFESDYTEDEYF
jgi:hypothetical protein